MSTHPSLSTRTTTTTASAAATTVVAIVTTSIATSNVDLSCLLKKSLDQIKQARTYVNTIINEYKQMNASCVLSALSSVDKMLLHTSQQLVEAGLLSKQSQSKQQTSEAPPRRSSAVESF